MIKAKSTRVIRRLKGTRVAILANCYKWWAESSTRERRKNDVLCRFVMRLKHTSLLAALHSWRLLVMASRKLRILVARKWKLLTPRRRFDLWKTWTLEQAKKRDLLGQIVPMIRNAAVFKAFAVWKDNVNKHCRQSAV